MSCRERSFHLSLSVAHSSMMFQAFISLMTLSFHRNLGLHPGRFPPSLFPQLLVFSDPFQPSPSHKHRSQFHLRFLQDLLISPTFQQVHTHYPSSSLFWPNPFHILLTLAAVKHVDVHQVFLSDSVFNL